MSPATVHGVEVITKLYFIIFAAFKESMTSEVIQGHTFWWGLKAHVRLYIGC